MDNMVSPQQYLNQDMDGNIDQEVNDDDDQMTRIDQMGALRYNMQLELDRLKLQLD